MNGIVCEMCMNETIGNFFPKDFANSLIRNCLKSHMNREPCIELLFLYFNKIGIFQCDKMCEYL